MKPRWQLSRRALSCAVQLISTVKSENHQGRADQKLSMSNQLQLGVWSYPAADAETDESTYIH